MNLTDRTFIRLVLSAMTIGFAALIAAGAMAIWTVSRNQDHARLIEHAYQVNATIGRYRIQLERAETARRGYLLDQSALFEREYAAAKRAAAEALDGLMSLIRDPQQHQRYARLRALTRVEVAAMNVSMGLAQSGDLGSAQAIFDDEQSVSALLEIRALSEQMTTAQDALQVQRGIDQRASLLLLYVVLAGAGLLLLLVGLGSGWAVRRYIGSLASSRDELRDANANLENAVDERTADLQRANDEIQRFAYIISHDLRAPLVNIMGFTAELEGATKLLGDYVEQAHAQSPADVPQAMAAAEPYDIIAVDHNMPGQDGLATLEALRQLPDCPPVVYVTGSEDPRVAVAAMKAGASDYIVKSTGGDFVDLLESAFSHALEGVRLRTGKAAAEDALRVSNARLETLLREVNHRVSNSLQMVSAFVHMQSKSLSNHEAREALQDTERRIQAIAQVHRRLYTSDDVESVAMDEYLSALVEELEETWSTSAAPRPIRLEAEALRLHPDKAVSLGVIVNELVCNACKYAYGAGVAGEVRVRFARAEPAHFYLVVEDDGCGLSAGAAPHGSGLGSRLVLAMAKSLVSSLDYDPAHRGVRASLRAAI